MPSPHGTVDRNSVNIVNSDEHMYFSKGGHINSMLLRYPLSINDTIMIKKSSQLDSVMKGKILNSSCFKNALTSLPYIFRTVKFSYRHTRSCSVAPDCVCPTYLFVGMFCKICFTEMQVTLVYVQVEVACKNIQFVRVRKC